MDANTDWAEVEALTQKAEQSGGTIGVTIVAPDGDVFEYRGDQQFGAASTVKIPLMIEVYRQIERGRLSLDDPYELQRGDRAAGTGVLLHLHEGVRLTLHDLIYLMISISDNTATNILIDGVGTEAVNATMASLGMQNSALNRKMMGRAAKSTELENLATPNDYARVIKEILELRAASASSCKKMIAMLEKQQCKQRISRYLPDREDVRWGSKTGNWSPKSGIGKEVTNDVGFITTSRGTLIISVFCESLADQHEGEYTIGNISRAAMKATGVIEPLSTS